MSEYKLSGQSQDTYQAEIAYEAYASALGGKNLWGIPLHDWDTLPLLVKDAWIAAAAAVRHDTRNEPLT